MKNVKGTKKLKISEKKDRMIYCKECKYYHMYTDYEALGITECIYLNESKIIGRTVLYGNKPIYCVTLNCFNPNK